MSRPLPTRTRPQDWPERLGALVEERRNVPFAWGTQDCVLFAADAALAVVDADPMAEFRGQYDTEAGAEELMAGRTFEATVAELMERFGAPECPPGFAQRGDWALVSIGNQEMAGVVIGTTIAVPNANGLSFVPVGRATRAWAI